jgi:hypothetical protein
MSADEQFSGYYADLLEGRYDCVDRLVVNAYFAMGQTGGGGFMVMTANLTIIICVTWLAAYSGNVTGDSGEGDRGVGVARLNFMPRCFFG